MLPALQLDPNPLSCSGWRLLYPAAVFGGRPHAQTKSSVRRTCQKKKKKEARDHSQKCHKLFFLLKNASKPKPPQY